MKNFYFIFIFLVLKVSAQEPIDTDGNGYRNISTLEQLRWISENDSSWSWNFELDNDIDASDTRNWNLGDHDKNPNTPDSAMGWKPIGFSNNRFTGIFNGNNFKILNIFINRKKYDISGLFGYTNSAQIINLGVEKCNIYGYGYVGALVAINSDYSTIRNCFSTGNINGGKDIIGGLVGYNMYYSVVKNCYSLCSVSGYSRLGGLIGWNVLSDVINSYSTGNLSGMSEIGGLVGYNSNISMIIDSYSIGHITSENKLSGGLVAKNDSYFLVINSFWDTELSGIETSAGGKGLNSKQMKTDSIFFDAKWNFVSIWQIDDTVNDGYPYIEERTIEVTKGIKPTDTDNNGFINISLFEHLVWISENDSSWSWNFELDNDINASETYAWNNLSGFSPIGNNSISFKGIFDGNNHRVDSLYIIKTNQLYAGLFGNTEEAEISNIGVSNSKIIGMAYVGGLIGKSYKTIVNNCYSTGNISGRNYYIGGLIGGSLLIEILDSYSITTVIGGSSWIGGLIGSNLGYVTNCYSNCIVKGTGNAGGLIGTNSGAIENCYNSGEVISTGDDVGGLVGFNRGNNISNCYSTVVVKGRNAVGGLVGKNYHSFLNECYFSGNVSGNNYVGGLVGVNYDNAKVKNSYSTGEVKGDNDVGGLIGSNYHSSLVFLSYSTSDIYASGKRIGGLVGKNHINSSINNCYSAGNLQGDSFIGGLVGYNESTIRTCYSISKVMGNENLGGFVGFSGNSNIYNCFWDYEHSGIDSSDNGIAKSTAQMKTESTFTDAGWDFYNTWFISDDYNNGYPTLFGVGNTVTGIYEREPNKNFYAIHPNPASDYIEISFSNKGLQPFANSDEIAIYDVLGERVAHSSTSVPSGHLRQRRTQKIDISHLPSDAYFIKIGNRTEKFVKR